jgi:hypothetical protein
MWQHGVSTMGVPLVDAQRSSHTCVGPCTTAHQESWYRCTAGDQVWSSVTLFARESGQQSRRCWSCKGGPPPNGLHAPHQPRYGTTAPAALYCTELSHYAGSGVHTTAAGALVVVCQYWAHSS